MTERYTHHMEMPEDAVCAYFDDDPEIKTIVADRILNADYRSSDWDGVINYLGEEVSVLSPAKVLLPTVSVVAGEVRRGLVLRGAAKYTQDIEVWCYAYRGIAGKVMVKKLIAHAMSLHEHSLPDNTMLLMGTSTGAIDDGENYYGRVVLSRTFLPQEVK